MKDNILNSGGSNSDKTQALYTAVSRAKEYLAIISDNTSNNSFNNTQSTYTSNTVDTGTNDWHDIGIIDDAYDTDQIDTSALLSEFNSNTVEKVNDILDGCKE
jgi:hypothetical protein